MQDIYLKITHMNWVYAFMFKLKYLFCAIVFIPFK